MSAGISPNEVAGYAALAGVICKFLLDAYGKWTKAQAEEAARKADQEKLREENTEWMREKVDEMVAHERDAYRATLDAFQRELKALRDQIAAIPALVEDLAILIARIDPSRTPSQEEVLRLRKHLLALGVRESAAFDILLHKALP